MLSAIKKLTTRQDATPSNQAAGTGQPNTPCMPMSGSLQKKFAKGVQYNMKIIIKGDRNVGKSCLLERLQGRGFIETYTPSEEINVASIQWSFKATEDIVKVEVWDVVDRGRARARPSGLKIIGRAPAPETPALDAEFLDVYKGTHGVILMMDITKNWTFDYVCKELPKIPSDIPVLLLGNHCDMSHHRAISQGQAMGLIEELGRRSAEVLYGESSMRNGFGLRLLHKFLGLPFLQLQRETLTALLERNQRDIDVCSMELTEFLTSPDSDYGKFLENLVNKRRQIADSNPKNTTHFTGNSFSSSSNITQWSPEKSSPFDGQRATKSIIIGAGQPIIVPGQRPISVAMDASTPTGSQIKQNTMGVLAAASVVNPNNIPTPMPTIKGDSNVTSVEEFCPDGGTLDKNFLDEVPSSNASNPLSAHSDHNYDSDSDSNDIGNPLVAKFHDDLSDDLAALKLQHAPNLKQNNANTSKVNPLAKNRSKQRRNSLSSEDAELPSILKDSSDLANSSGSSKKDFDSWLSDSTYRRSPEGIEAPSIDKSVNSDTTFIDNGERINSDDAVDSNDKDRSERQSKTKSKKKKKDKKEKHDKSVKSEKVKKRSKRSNSAEHMLSEQFDREHSPTMDNQYEALH